MCREYRISARDLCLAYTEIVAAMHPPFVSGQETQLAATAMFVNPPELEKFLGELHRATFGQTALQRRLAIVACAKHQAQLLSNAIPKPGPLMTRNRLLKDSIITQFPTVILCVIILVVGMLIAIYLT